MARIRSVHPALFTDESFVSLSDSAQIFWVGLWCEADDQGVFEWKPLTLKMRTRPAGSVKEALEIALQRACAFDRLGSLDPSLRRLESLPTRKLGVNIDLFPFRMAPRLQKFFEAREERVHKPFRTAIPVRALGPIEDR